jgi:hypothetical protein
MNRQRNGENGNENENISDINRAGGIWRVSIGNQ